MSRAFAGGPLGALRSALSWVLPGASAYWGIGARRLARRKVKAAATGLVIGCRMPPTTQRGRHAGPGWEQVTVLVDGESVASFWSAFKKAPKWVPHTAGPLVVRVENGAPPPVLVVEFELAEGDVVVVDVVPSMITGPRRVEPARIDVVDASNHVVASSG